MGRRGYPAEFRRRVGDLVEAGRKVTDVARDLGVSNQTIYTWRRQEQIDRGLVPGLSSVEREELAAAKRRIRELEAELGSIGGPPSSSRNAVTQKAVRGDRSDGRGRTLGPACLSRARGLGVGLLRPA